MPTNLESLSDDVLLLILEYLEHYVRISAIRSLSAVSRRFYPFSEDVLYKKLFFRRGDVCHALLRNVERRPARAQAIRSIEARCMRDFQNGLHSLPVLLSQTAWLEELIVESPLCNYTGPWRGEYGWNGNLPSLLATLASAARPNGPPQILELPLQRLKRLTLHLSGPQTTSGRHYCRFWIVEKSWAKIFAHPSLEELSLSYAAFPTSALREIRNFPRTPLKRLKLVECHVTHEAIHDMLAMPLALEYLHIGEARENVGCQHEWERPRWHLDPRTEPYDRLCQRNILKVMHALQQQASSLKFLGYSANMEYTSKEMQANLTRLLEDPSADFKSFTNLIEIFCSNGGAFDDLLFDKRFSAPQYLQTLTIFIPPQSPWTTSLYKLRPAQSLAEKRIMLKTFDLFMSDVFCFQFWELEFRNGRQAIDRIAQGFRDKAARMRVWGYFARTWCPPYLYGQMRLQQKLRVDTHFPDNHGWVDEGDWQLCSEDFY